jgi:hypothetical protein
VFCDIATEVCVPGTETDCGGFGPAHCDPIADGGGGDAGGGDAGDGG